MRNKKDTDDFSDYSVSAERGNVYWFFGGLLVLGIGLYMVFQNTVIHTAFVLPTVFGYAPKFGIVLIPLLIGIIMVFFNSSSIWGWFFVIAGLLIIVVGILMGLTIRFQPISLFEGIMMFGMVAAGLGTTLKGLYGKA